MSLSERDSKVLWHPFTQAATDGVPIALTHGEGAWLYSESGKRYLDAISSWWVNLHGHAHPTITAAISEQAQKLEQVIFAGFTHEPAITIAERLVSRLPELHTKLFLSDNGSTAVEVGVKMAIQFHHNRGQKRHRIIVLQNSYHGDTFGTMSVSERDTFTTPFSDFLFEVVAIPAPMEGQEEASREALQNLLKHDDCIAFVFEPLVQGAGGMFMHSAEALSALLALCKKHNVITVADEVMTGFGRTGTLFASDKLSTKPDIICLSKGITGGFLPLGATSCTEELFETFFSEDRTKMFTHGHSFSGNPLSCAAANASLTLLESEDCQKQLRMIEALQGKFVQDLRKIETVENARSTGTILALDVATPEKTSYFNNVRQHIYDHFIEKGILLRPLGNVLYLLPPYCITEEELSWCHQEILDFITSR